MPRRILLLITDLQIGGTPTVVRELALRLRDASTELEVACLSDSGPVADQLREAGVFVKALGMTNQWQLLRASRDLVRLVRERNYDTVVSFLVHANLVAAIASRFCRHVRFIQSIQTTQENPRWHWIVQSIAQHAAEVVIVPSASAARVARDRAHVPAAKVVVIPNAVDADDFPRSQIPFASPLPYPIGFVGRLDPVKRIPDLVDVVAHLRDRVHLHIFGEGSEREQIESRIHSLKLSAVVTLHGAVARPQDALTRIGLLVLPSSAEGFGLVLIEAMASGVPVVATDVPGIRDVVRHGETGLLVNPASPMEMVFAIRKIAEDVALRSKLIENGLREVREKFSWRIALAEYRRVLQRQ